MRFFDIIPRLNRNQLDRDLARLQSERHNINVNANVNGNKNVENLNEHMHHLNNTGRDSSKVFSDLRIKMGLYLTTIKAVKDAVSGSIKTIKTYDNYITDIANAMGSNREEAEDYLISLNKSGKELKATTSEMAEGADSFLRQGKTIAETDTLIRNSMVLSKVAKMDSADSTNILTAAMNSFNIAAKDTISVVDKLTSVDLVSASSANGLGIALGKSASAAKLAGIEIDKLISMLAVMKEAAPTESDESIGNAMKSILSRMNQVKAGKFIDEETGESLNDVEKVLSKVSIEMRDTNDQFIDSEKILDNVGQKWSTFDSVTKRAISTAIAGTYQYNRFIALMDGYSKVLEYTTVAQNSSGQAMEKFKNYEESLDAKTKLLQNSLESLAYDTFGNEFYGAVIDATTGLVQFAEKTQIVKEGLNVLGIVGGAKLFTIISTSIVGAVKHLNDFNTALSILKTGDVTSSFSTLLACTDGLNKSQLNLILTSNALTTQQRIAILARKGLTEEEITATISTLNLASAEGVATGATTTMSGAVKGLGASFRALAVANPVITTITVLGSAIYGSVKAYDALTQSVEETKERIDELMSSYKSALDIANNNADRVEELSDDYERLSKGVNNLGENVSLTSEEYEKYNSLVNEIAEMFPAMVQGYTDEGNAILNLKGNVEELRDAYKEAQQEAYNLLIASGKDSDGNDILKDANNTINNGSLDSPNWGNLEKIDYINKLMNATNSVDDMLKLWNSSLNSSYQTWFEDFAGIGGTDGISKLTDKDLADIRKNIKVIKQQYQAEINSAVDNVETLANAYLMTNEEYAKLDEQSKNAASIMVNSLNANIVSKFGENKENVGKYVEDIVKMISDNPNVKDAMISLFTMDTTDMTVGKIQSDVDLYLSTIAEAIHEDKDSLKIRLGFDDSDTEALVNKVQGFLSDEFDDKVGELTVDELDKASKLEIPEGTLLSWDELIERIEKAKNETDNTEILSFTDAFNSSDFKDAKDKLLELAKAGELTPETIKSTEEYATLLTQTGLSAEQATSEILNTLTAQEKLSAASQGLDKLSKSYEEFKDIGFVTASTLESLPDVFKNLPSYDIFTQIVGDPQSGVDKIQQAFNDIVKDYLVSQNTLSGLIDASESQINSYVANLEQMGVTNAKEIVNQIIEQLKAESDLFDKAEEEYVNYLNSKDEAQLEFINSSGSYNSQLIAGLGEAYKADYGNWISLLEKKTDAYNKFVDAIGGSYDENLSVIDNMVKNDPTKISANSIVNAYTAEAEYKKQKEEADKAYGELQLKYASFKVESEYSGSKSSSKSSSSSEKSFDWISTEIERLNEELDRLDEKTSNTYSSWTERNNALKDSINKTSEAIRLQEQAYTAYMNEANSVGLSDTYKKLVQNGALKIEDISDSDLADKISEYQDLYDKAIQCQDTANELRQTLNELSTSQAWDNIKVELDADVDAFDANINALQTKIDKLELQGMFANSSYYSDMASLTQKKISILTSEANQLQSILNGMTQGTEAYDTMFSELMDIRQQIAELENDCIEFNKTIRDLDWEIFEYLEDSINRITDETEYLVELLSKKDLYDDNGNLTKYADATIGLHAVAYDTYKQQAQDYYEEVQELQKQLLNGAGQEVLEQYNEMVDAHQEAILAAEQEKEAILDLVQDGYNAQLDALNEIISKKKEALNQEKNLYDYQKSIAEKTKNISSLEKQKLAYEGDTSEEAMSKIQKIKVDLEAARQDLEETQYEQYLQDSQDMLDTLSSDFEAFINQRLDNEDELLTEIVNTVAGKSDEINETLSEVANEYGTFVSDSITSVFNADSPFTSALTNGLSEVSTSIAGTTAAINALVTKVANITGTDANKTNAGTNNSNGSGSSNTSNVPTPTTPSSNTSNGSSSNNSNTTSNSQTTSSATKTGKSLLDDILIDKKDSYPKNKLNRSSVVDELKYFDKDSSFSARAMYWSKIFGGTYTGSASQNAKLLNYLKGNGYAKGSKYIPYDQIALLGEEGNELQFDKSQGVLREVGEGDKIFTNEASQVLWNFSKNPSEFIEKFGLANVTPQFNFATPALPDMVRNNASSSVSIGDINITCNEVQNAKELMEDVRSNLLKNTKFMNGVGTYVNNHIMNKNSLEHLKFARH